ncbi:MAG: hypothetical protein ABSE77_23560, partial [Acidimicrobiales bacterium]
MEAAASFPGNVKCKTAHALAYPRFGAQLKQRLSGPRRPSSYNATVLGARGLRAGVASFEPAAMATMAMTTVARFCRSAGPEVSAEHFTVPEGLDAACLGPLTEAVVALAKKAWQDLTSTDGKLRAYHDVYLKHWQLSQPKLDYDVILYDEAQDADACVADVVGRQDHAQLVAVGDSAQALYCQPAETMVTVVRQRPTCGRGHSLTDPANLYTWRGKTSCRACRKEAMHIRREDYVGNPVTYTEAVPIEQVKAGDMVVSYDMAHSFLRRTGSRVSRNEQRDHPGPLVKVEVGAITTRYTPDHECIVRFGKAWAGKYVLYVMRRGNDYRVGISRARYASQQGRLGAIARAAGEKADALWVLAVYQDRTSACVAEATAAWKYRVPDLTFRAEQSVVVGLTQASLDDIWKVIGDNAVDASSLLTAFGRNLEYPLWERGQLMPAARRATVTRASNLLDGMEMLPAANAYDAKGKRVTHQRWEPIQVSRERHDGAVWSMSVERDHTYVGDGIVTHNSWRGASDFLARVEARHRLALSQSWRFGAAIADEANVWLGIVGSDLRVVGDPSRSSALAELAEPDAVLCRTNATTIDEVLAAHAKGTKVHLEGDGSEVLALARAAQRMQEGKPCEHPELVAFPNWAAVQAYAENDPFGSDLAVAVRMIGSYGASTVIEAIEGTVATDEAELVVSTAHKAKGLEWAKVRVAYDFKEPREPKSGQLLPVPRELAMLGYVTVTRAKEVLDTAGLAWVHRHLDALGQGVPGSAVVTGARPDNHAEPSRPVSTTAGDVASVVSSLVARLDDLAGTAVGRLGELGADPVALARLEVALGEVREALAAVAASTEKAVSRAAEICAVLRAALAEGRAHLCDQRGRPCPGWAGASLEAQGLRAKE